MLIAILARRKTLQQGQLFPYFQCGPSIRVKQEKKM